MSKLYFNYTGEHIIDNAKILALVVKKIKGTSIRVAPFKDNLLVKFGVWLLGDQEEILDKVEVINKILRDKKIPFNVMEWDYSNKRG